jgi:opacity protein-like surface antigen
MRNSQIIIVAILAIACIRAVASDPGELIDLSSFSSLDPVRDTSEAAVENDAVALTPVAYGEELSRIRGYVSAIAGASFGTINPGGTSNFSGSGIQIVGSASEAMFTGGGAIGMALDRPSGLLRMEVEGRARGPLHGQNQIAVTDPSGTTTLPIDTNVSGGWSAMTNFWRDFFITDRFGIYAGGGFGVGGYQYSTLVTDGSGSVGGAGVVNTFAWQVGTGLTYTFNDRVTFDTGYRFFAMSPGATPLGLSTSSYSQIFGTTTSALSASELLLSVRIYEPFRNWR